MSLTAIYNGKNLTKAFVLSELSRPLPEFRDATTEIEGADGVVFDGLTVGVREVSFTLTARARDSKSVQDSARKLMRLLSVQSPKALTFSDEVDDDGVQLVRYAVPTGAFDAEEFIRAGRWTCRFRQHDPYLYGKARSVVLKANRAKTVQAGGNAESWAVAVSNPSGSRYTLGIENGKGIVIKAPFDGETLRIDFERERITVNPAVANAEGIQTSSRFFPMRGTMDLIASSATTLTWSERWL